MVDGRIIVAVFGCSMTACHVAMAQYKKAQPLTIKTVSYYCAMPQDGNPSLKILPVATQMVDAIILVGHDGCVRVTEAQLDESQLTMQRELPHTDIVKVWLHAIPQPANLRMINWQRFQPN